MNTPGHIDWPPEHARSRRRVFVGLAVAVGILFFATGPWIRFKPVCTPKGTEDQGSVFELLMGFRFLDGEMRPDFRDVIADSIFYKMEVFSLIFVNIKYYIDAELQWNYTTKAIGTVIGSELRVGTDLNRALNPEFYDKDGIFRSQEFEDLHEKFGYVGHLNYNKVNCDLYRFFTIKGAPLPRNLSRVLDHNPSDWFDEDRPISPTNYRKTRRADEKIIKYFSEKYKER